MRRLLVCSSALALIAAVAASSAMAATVPVPLSFNNVVLSTPGTPNTAIVTPKTAPLTMTAQVDLLTGAFTVAPSDFTAPSYAFTSPVPGTVQLALGQAASGQTNPTTGAVSLSADVRANITLNGIGSCVIDPGTLTYSTDNKGTMSGVRFPAGAQGAVTGTGAILGSWSTLPGGTGAGCALVDSAVKGAGFLWISRNIAPPAPVKPAALALSAKPAKASVKAGKSASFTVTVKNTGGSAATRVKVCASVPKALKASKCATVSSIAAGASKKLTFTVKASKKAHGTYAVKFTATGKSLSAHSTSHLKVLKIK